MKYFFVLGSNPALSVAEICASIKTDVPAKLLAGTVLVLEIPATDAKKLIKRLGGTIKIGVIHAEVNRHDNKKTKEEIINVLDKNLNEREDSNKFCFGLSYYGKNNFPSFPIGLAIKKDLRANGVSCRLVTSKEKVLSSVVVEQNKLVADGAEIVLIEESNSLFIGQTEAVQPFKELSYRDFGRPGRDDKSGMIPPKLAQIMLNLSGKIKDHCEETTKPCFNAVILDPFCGSGTILTEAGLMGVKHIFGADISEKAIQDTKINVKWIKENIESSLINFQLFTAPVENISQVIKEKSVDAIVTEPYLGPQRGFVNIRLVTKELEQLYSEALAEFKKILKPDGIVVMVFPAFVMKSESQVDFIEPDLNGFEIINPLPENLISRFKITSRGTIIYGRTEQKVWREIVVLKIK